jgi:plastocyanin
MGVGLVFVVATACSGGMATSPNSSPVVGGHSTTIVASGASSSGGGGGGYAVISPLATYSFNPTPDTVAAGAMVTFEFQNVTHWVTFDLNPGDVANIPQTSNADSTRTFVTPGTYTYHCAIHTYMHGTVVVQ